MEDELHMRLIGQDAAVRAVRQGHPPQPRRAQRTRGAHGLVHLLGPSGVGKTELARTLAAFLFGDEDHSCRST